MRRSVARAAAALLVGLALPACARAAWWSVHAGVGATFPAGGAALQEGLATGLIANAGVGCAISSLLQIVVRGTYSDYPRDDEGSLRVAAIDRHPFRVLETTGGGMRAWDAVAELRFTPSAGAARVRPYVLGAAGLSSYRYERVDIAFAYAGHTWPVTIPGEEGTAACVAAGGGVRFAACRWLEIAVDSRLQVALRDNGALWYVPLWLELAVSP